MNRNLHLELTRECNSKCITCNFWKQKDPDNSLTLNEWKTVIYHYSDVVNAKWVQITGGEPFLKFLDCLELIDICNNLGLKSHINTNGLCLDEYRVCQVLDSGLNVLAISLNSHIERVHDYTRGMECFKHIRKLLGCCFNYTSKTKIKVNSILAEWNYNHFIDFIRWCEKFGVDQFDFNILSTPFWNSDNFELKRKYELQKVVMDIYNNYHDFPNLIVTKDRLLEMINYCKHDQKTNHNRTCLSPDINYIVDVDGNIRLCFTQHFSTIKGLKIGNVRRVNFVDLDNSKYVQVYRRKLKNHCYRWCAYVNCNQEVIG